MGTWDFSHFLSDWIAAFLVSLTTLGLARACVAVLRRLARNPRRSFLEKLSPSIAHLIYIVGVRAVVDVVPLHPKVVLWLDNGAYILAVLILLGLGRKALLIAIEWSALKSMSSNTLQQGFIPLMRNVVTLFVLVSGGIMVLKHFNYDVMSLVTALGVGSLAVGLASKDTLSNMISGFTLIIDRNLSPGDTVNITGSVGTVDEIGLRSTRIRTGDGNMLIVPNNDLVNTKILNLSLPAPATSANLQLRIPYTSPFEKAREVILNQLAKTDGIKQDLGQGVLLASLSEGHQLLTVYFWISSASEQGKVLSELNQGILTELSHQNIPLIPRATWV